MDTLSTRQSIAACVIDLAEGYKHRYGLGDGRFVLQCCELALTHYPNYINALLLKAETLKIQIEAVMQQYRMKDPSQIKTNPDLQTQFLTTQAVYGQIHSLGYRHMPKQMYLKWLQQLQAEKSKYINNQVSNPLQTK